MTLDAHQQANTAVTWWVFLAPGGAGRGKGPADSEGREAGVVLALNTAREGGSVT